MLCKMKAALTLLLFAGLLSCADGCSDNYDCNYPTCDGCECINNDYCKCDTTQFTGDNCTTPAFCQDRSDCGDHGDCAGNTHCECDEGWGGEDGRCDQPDQCSLECGHGGTLNADCTEW